MMMDMSASLLVVALKHSEDTASNLRSLLASILVQFRVELWRHQKTLSSSYIGI
jgi:hypothetical protein